MSVDNSLFLTTDLEDTQPTHQTIPFSADVDQRMILIAASKLRVAVGEVIAADDIYHIQESGVLAELKDKMASICEQVNKASEKEFDPETIMGTFVSDISPLPKRQSSDTDKQEWKKTKLIPGVKSFLQTLGLEKLSEHINAPGIKADEES